MIVSSNKRCLLFDFNCIFDVYLYLYLLGQCAWVCESLSIAVSITLGDWFEKLQRPQYMF